MTAKRDSASDLPLDSIEGLSSFLGVSRRMVLQSNLDPLLQLIMDEATELMDAERSTLYLLNETSGQLTSYIAQQAEITQIVIPVGTGIAGHVAQTGERLNLEDAYECDLFDPAWDRKTGFRTRSVLCAPMRDRNGKVMGVIQVLDSRKRRFSAADEAAMELFASHAAVAIDNVRLREDLRLVFTSAIRALAEAVDKRDPATAGHSARVSYYAVKLGQAAGMDSEEIAALEYASTLHDIGKIGVPDQILSKPSRLTEEEFAVMRSHAAISREILETSYFTGATVEVPFVVGAHHERLDGSGYPDGLASDQLTRPARILAIADVYDAVTSFDRPYRRAMAPEQALEILKADVPHKLDAELVNTFIEQDLYVMERRQLVRLDMEATVEYRILPLDRFAKEMARHEAQGRDISGSGIRFAAREFIPVGSYLDVVVRLGEDAVRLHGRVVRSERSDVPGQFEVGVIFLDLTDGSRQRLQHYLVDVLPRGRPPEAGAQGRAGGAT